MPQGSVLGHLFVIYINDLDENLVGMVSKFADDAKIGGIVDSEEGYLGLQWDLSPELQISQDIMGFLASAEKR